MKELPKGHAWLCEPCGSSAASHMRHHVVSYTCPHTQEDADRALAQRLLPYIKEYLNL